MFRGVNNDSIYWSLSSFIIQSQRLTVCLRSTMWRRSRSFWMVICRRGSSQSKKLTNVMPRPPVITVTVLRSPTVTSQTVFQSTALTQARYRYRTRAVILNRSEMVPATSETRATVAISAPSITATATMLDTTWTTSQVFWLLFIAKWFVWHFLLIT